MREGPCTVCGSDQVIPRVQVVDRGDHNEVGNLQARVDGAPEAIIFKDRLYATLSASICGACGHVELWADRPQQLYQKYLKSQGHVEPRDADRLIKYVDRTEDMGDEVDFR